jgi:protein-tyrosine phosphatase
MSSFETQQMQSKSNGLPSFVDIHCHLVPAIDDGATSYDESLLMARIAVEDGIHTIVVTPHQMGNYARNSAAQIRRATSELQEFLRRKDVPLRVLPGADVRVEEDLLSQIQRGEVMTLADRKKHILLELPHELYFDLLPLIGQLRRLGIQSILSHPERNLGLLSRPEIVTLLVDQGCLMQVTCGSLLGTFGDASQQMAELLLKRGQVHFLATDAHGPKVRRPKMADAFQRTAEICGLDIAKQICCANPAAVAAGEPVSAGPLKPRVRRRSWFRLGQAA